MLLNSRWARPEGGEKGVAGEKGSFGKAETLKTEILKGTRPRKTPMIGGIERIRRDFHFPRA
jgi:hypothetical protein